MPCGRPFCFTRPVSTSRHTILIRRISTSDVLRTVWPARSLADEAALMDLVLPPDVSDEDEEDPRYLAYDRRRDRDEEVRAGCW